MLSKIKTILLSRFKTTTEEKWISDRKRTCSECKYNTLNGGSLRGYRFFLAIASYQYSRLVGKGNKDILGECSICGCSVLYKAEDRESYCPHEPPKWEILEDNSMKLNIREHRKNESK